MQDTQRMMRDKRSQMTGHQPCFHVRRILNFRAPRESLSTSSPRPHIRLLFNWRTDPRLPRNHRVVERLSDEVMMSTIHV